MPQPFDPATLRIPAALAILGNGLRVVAHRDRKAPIVAVYVAYRAGSREESAGKYGLAHLFEHLMFSGSEHSRQNYFIPLERIGAASINANALDDYTAYFAAVPADALDYALWMEAERMSCLPGALGQEAFDRQREVVRNELRQRQAEPYGRVASLIRRHSYPYEHPYAHHPYGSIEDLDNLSLDDAARWFESGYGAASATVVIAGDVEPQDAIEKACHRFEAIPSGLPWPRRAPSPAKPERGTRLRLDENQVAGRIYRVWNVPGLGSPERTSLELVCELLAGGESSRLFKRLVCEARLATGISIELQGRELGSQIVLCATAAAGAPLAELDSALNSELSRFACEIPPNQECESAHVRIVSRFVRETERACGPRSRSDVLASATLATGDPGTATAHLESMARLDAGAIAESAARWLDATNLVIEVSPPERIRPRPRSLVHEGPPAPPAPTPFRWPEVMHARLENGLRVMHIKREGGAPVELRLVFETGAATESSAVSGLASLAMALMSRMRAGSDGVRVGEELARLGSTLRGRVALEGSVIESSLTTGNLPIALSQLERVVVNPQFDEIDLNQVKSQCTAIIREEMTQPLGLAPRILPRLVYPDGHPYARPFSGSGTEESIAGVTADQLRDFYLQSLRPNRATLVVVGPIETRELVALAERTLGAWEPSSNRAAEPVAPCTELSRTRVALIDRDGMAQARIFAALPLPPRRDPDLDALTVANAILGGMFSSRLNLALRETRGWSYGAQSRMIHARFGGLWILHAFVRPDRTADAMKEIQRQLRGIVRRQPIDDAELARARDYLVASLPAIYETNAQLAEALENLVRYDLPDNYYPEMAARLMRLRPRDLSRACRRRFGAGHIAWLVIADAARIAPQLSSAGLGDPEIIDAV